MRDRQSSRRIPVLHTLMGVPGWALYALVPHTPTLILAGILTLLAVPRFIRGPWEKADKLVTEELKRPIKPSKRIARAIAPNEQLLWETQEHPITLLIWIIGSIAVTAGAVAIGIYFNWMAGLIVGGVGLLIFGIRILVWREDRICLTNKRILGVRGILKVQYPSMPLSKLTDETLQTPWHSTILSWLRIIRVEYGTLIVESAGQDQALSKVYFVPNAIQVNRIIMEKALG